MQTSDQIVKTLLEDGEDEAMPDPKKIALSTHNDSELFEDFMRNYTNECRNLFAQAKSCGALAGDEPEGIVIRAVMQIAAKKFAFFDRRNDKVLKNLERFL